MTVQHYLVTYSVLPGRPPTAAKIEKALRKRFEKDPGVSVTVTLTDEDGIATAHELLVQAHDLILAYSEERDHGSLSQGQHRAEAWLSSHAVWTRNQDLAKEPIETDAGNENETPLERVVERLANAAEDLLFTKGGGGAGMRVGLRDAWQGYVDYVADHPWPNLGLQRLMRAERIPFRSNDEESLWERYKRVIDRLAGVEGRIRNTDSRLDEGMNTLHTNVRTEFEALNVRIDTVTARLNRMTGTRLYETDPEPDETVNTRIDMVTRLMRKLAERVVALEGSVEVPNTDTDTDTDEIAVTDFYEGHEAVRQAERQAETRSDGQLLSYMGVEAERWAQEFMKIGARGVDDPTLIDEGLMLSWFANAIEAGRSSGADALHRAEVAKNRAREERDAHWNKAQAAERRWRAFETQALTMEQERDTARTERDNARAAAEALESVWAVAREELDAAKTLIAKYAETRDAALVDDRHLCEAWLARRARRENDGR